MLGLCLGFELLLMATINGKNPLTSCDAKNMNLPLKLIPNMAKTSVLFREMPEDIKKTLLEEPVTANHHMYVYKLNIFNMSLTTIFNLNV